ncbi:hypothetical protein C8Q77DRAFT_894865 [Trametes polyzona]|nr:hypothetical protein C8Q77DRAFT_894865 [Trametes polyzona]
MMYLQVLEEHVLVLGDAQVALECLDKRSANSADRTTNPTLELSGQGFKVVFMPYGQRWRQRRRLFWQYFHPGVVKSHQPIQRAEAHKFIGRLAKSPSRLTQHITQLFTLTMLKTIYDIDALTEMKNKSPYSKTPWRPSGRRVPAISLSRDSPFCGTYLRGSPARGFRKSWPHPKEPTIASRTNSLTNYGSRSLNRGQDRACIAADMLARQRLIRPVSPLNDWTCRRMCVP